jgi:hypothetical protein
VARSIQSAVPVRGFEGVSAALLRIEGRGDFGIEYEMHRQLRAIGEHVAAAAPGFVTHKTGRHPDPENPRLEDSVRVSVTQRSASVYSTALHGGVQNFGGGPHAGWAARGPHVRKDRASRWMTRAVESQEAYVRESTEKVLDWVISEWEKG